MNRKMNRNYTNTKYKKRRILVGTALMLTMVFTGCGQSTGSSVSTDGSTTEAVTITTEVTENRTEATTEAMSEKATESTTEATVSNEETVDLSGMDSYAVAEIQSEMDKINTNIESTNQAEDAAVIRQSVELMGLAAGNSLAEEQVALVVKDWKQGKSDAQLEEFRTKYALVYDAYMTLTTEEAEEQLKKIDLSIADYSYCGEGRLDIVEWIKTYMEQ